MSTSEIATVHAWHDALDDSDLDTLLELSSGDIELAGPKGATRGLAALREWAEAAGVVPDQVTSVHRHDDLRSALAATDLGEKDLVVDA